MVHPSDIQNIITIVPGAIEKVLFLIYSQLRRQDRERTSNSLEGIEEKLSARPEDNSEHLEIASQLAEREDALRELRGTI
jgi:hypothetical protein